MATKGGRALLGLFSVLQQQDSREAVNFEDSTRPFKDLEALIVTNHVSGVTDGLETPAVQS